MWTPAARAELARESLPYATSLTNAEWALVVPVLPTPAATGRPRRWPMRHLFDAILHVLRTGCAWRHLPQDFPPWGTVHRWFLRLSQADGRSESLKNLQKAMLVEKATAEAEPFGPHA